MLGLRPGLMLVQVFRRNGSSCLKLVLMAHLSTIKLPLTVEPLAALSLNGTEGQII